MRPWFTRKFQANPRVVSSSWQKPPRLAWWCLAWTPQLTPWPTRQRWVPAAYDVIEHETVQEFDGTVVKLKDASYRAVQRYLADVLHIKMSRPTRTKMLEAIKGLREAEVEAKLNAASQE